jgi:hypothetical protein
MAATAIPNQDGLCQARYRWRRCRDVRFWPIAEVNRRRLLIATPAAGLASLPVSQGLGRAWIGFSGGIRRWGPAIAARVAHAPRGTGDKPAILDFQTASIARWGSVALTTTDHTITNPPA